MEKRQRDKPQPSSHAAGHSIRLRQTPARFTNIAEEPFYLAEAHWPADAAISGQHTVIAVVHDKNGKELARIAPRLVSASWTQGY